MLIEKETFIIDNPKENPIICDISFKENSKNNSLIIFCHGYKGFKDWGAWNLIAEKFATAGFALCKFNFSLNGGTIDNPIDFPDLDAFGRNTFSQELKDLEIVTDTILKKYKENVDVNNITLIGHSRGGGIVLLRAAMDHRIKNVITWAGVSDFESRFPVEDELIKWKTDGVMYITNGRTKQNMPHYFSFYEDFINNKDNLNIEYAVKKLTIPQLIIHGLEDEAVSLNEAELLKKWNANAKLTTVSSGHTFGSSHPWKDKKLPSKLNDVVVKTISFLNKHQTDFN